MDKKNTSIQIRLMRMIMIICGTVLLLTCVAFFIYEYITYRQLTKREMETLAQITASTITSSIAFDDKEDATEVLEALKVRKNIEVACVYDKQGKLFAGYTPTPDKVSMPVSPQPDGFIFRGSYIEGSQPVIQEGTRLGTLYIRYHMRAVYNRFVLYGTIAFVFIGVSILFAFLLSRRLQGTIVNPILQLADKARIVSDKRDYSVRAEKKTNDELGVLTDAFNHMLKQIQAQNEEINALNANLEVKIAIRTNELKEANTTLREQNDFIETIIDASVDLIAVFDKDLRFIVLNKQADEIYGRSRNEMIGRKVLDVFPSLKDTAFMENLERAFAGEFVHEESYKSLVSSRHFENFFIPLFNKTKVIDRVMVIGHDITGIMQANEKLKQVNTELEKSNRDLEQFAYIASHDLQEPLRKIKTFSELSEKNVQHPEILKRYLQKISSSASRMTDLIKAVLNFSRLSRIETELINVDLNIEIRHIISDLELYIEEKGASVHVEPLPIVKGLPQQMNQLFLNLFTNALKFSDKQPEITIKSSIVAAKDFAPEVLQIPDSDFVKISFGDNGIGFDQQYAEKVFSIFQRLHPSDKYAGTGIGLSLCKKIVENHNGYIDVESQPGLGTTFYIYLPYDASIQNAKPEARQEMNSAS